MDVKAIHQGVMASFYALPLRQCDNQGCGHYGASRGSRKHKGIDLACNPGTAICSSVNGKVTKIGWPYADKRDIRYVQVTAGDYNYRVFYVEPIVEVGDGSGRYSLISLQER